MENVLKNAKNSTAISAFVIDGKKIESKCIGGIITINSLNDAIEKANQYLLPYLKYAVETRATGIVFLVNTDVIVGCIYQIGDLKTVELQELFIKLFPEDLTQSCGCKDCSTKRYTCWEKAILV